MKITPLTKHVSIAGTRECPSTQRRNRCPQCYALLPSYLWHGNACTCPICQQELRTIPLRAGFWGYFLTIRHTKSVLWQLFYVCIWIPAMLIDHYLKLKNLGFYGIIKVIT